jgi:protein-tyrosine phosphatase
MDSAHSCVNFRDIGGVPSEFGFVARGRLYRTAQLSGVDEHSAEHLARTLRIARYIDFRGESEIVRDGEPLSLLQRGVHWVRHPFELSDDAFSSLSRPAASDWQDLYLRAMRRIQPELAQAVRHIAEADGPVVFGCWVGKDRTGIVAALLLSLLGVKDDIIAQDFAKTTELLAPFKSQYTGLWQIEPEAAEAIFNSYTVASAETMLGFLAAVRSEFGSVQAALALDQATVDALRARYLVEHDDALDHPEPV